MGEERGEEAGVEVSRSDFLEDVGVVSEEEEVDTEALGSSVLVVRFWSLSVVIVGVTGVTGMTFPVFVSVGDFVIGC